MPPQVRDGLETGPVQGRIGVPVGIGDGGDVAIGPGPLEAEALVILADAQDVTGVARARPGLADVAVDVGDAGSDIDQVEIPHAAAGQAVQVEGDGAGATGEVKDAPCPVDDLGAVAIAGEFHIVSVELGVDKGTGHGRGVTGGEGLVPLELIEGTGAPVEVIEEAGHAASEGVDAGGVAGESDGLGGGGKVTGAVNGLDLGLVRLAVGERLELEGTFGGKLDGRSGRTAGETPGDFVAGDVRGVGITGTNRVTPGEDRVVVVLFDLEIGGHSQGGNDIPGSLGRRIGRAQDG